MSHHPERTARNVRPVNQPPSFSKVVAMHVPGVQKRGLRGGCAAFAHAWPGFATIASPTHDVWKVSGLPIGVKGISPWWGWAS